MFGAPKPKKIKGRVDRLVKGIIIGGAIGSVLGVSLAPKKRSKNSKAPVSFSNKAPKNTRKKKNIFQTIGSGVKILITGKK